MGCSEITELFTIPGLWIAFVITLIAGFMRGFIGIGSGMLMAPVFAILFGLLTTVTIIIFIELVVTFQLLPAVYRKIDWPMILPMSLTAALFMPVGAWVLVNVDADLMARVISMVVLLFVLLMSGGWRYHGKKRLLTTLGVGSISGTLMAATGLGGPPVMLYLLSGPDKAIINRANFTGYFLLTVLVLFGLMLFQGMLTVKDLLLATVLLPFFVLGAKFGARYFHRSSDRVYRYLALGLLLCVAIFGLLR